MSPETAILRVEDVAKQFGHTTALDGVSLDLRPGEIRGLLGHNGSGKSTLVKILSGVVTLDAGTVSIDGHSAVPGAPPTWWRAHGISVVHQDLGLVPTLPVWENLLVGRLPVGRGRFATPRRARRQARKELAELGSDISPDQLVAELSDAQRAELAIVRAVMSYRSLDHGGVLILDEPTAYLPAAEVRRLFVLMREVARRGGAVLFVSHKLGEVLEVTDSVSVLRAGRLVGTRSTADLQVDDLVEMILGPSSPPAAEPKAAAPRPGEALTATAMVTDLVSERLRSLSFTVAPGEIVGLTGLVGAGHEDVPYLLFGALHGGQGTLSLDGTRLDLAAHDPAAAVRHGIALVPGNRLRDGIIPDASVAANLGSVHDRRFTRRCIVRRRLAREWTTSVIQRYDIRPPDPSLPISALSGGNQQKVVLAKWLEMRPRLLCLHEPTQGIDIGAKRTVIRLLRESLADGMAIVVASNEAEELLDYCNRIIVVRDGCVAFDLDTAEVDGATLDRLVVGGELASGRQA
ncbi:MAG: Monosaccharide-transporting ATPase [Actinomycetia bacterium]|nr:Monosaccharide-transporting ATPase [Actinomycetes bacterium]